MNFQPLRGIRILSLSLNLPGPAALARCVQLGATCEKLEPIPAIGSESADPMHTYSPRAYADMHAGVAVWHANLKLDSGQQALHEHLTHTDVLLTSFRPAALQKLNMDWETLHQRHPQLCMVRIVGALGKRADEPGHDLTYQAEAGLLQDTRMPVSLFADMAGALLATEAILQALYERTRSGKAVSIDVGLAEAAKWMAQPWHWGLTRPESDIGGTHAGYQIYECRNGRVAVAALEPHFADRLWSLAAPKSQGLPATRPNMQSTEAHRALQSFFASKSCAELQRWSLENDLPIYVMTA